MLTNNKNLKGLVIRATDGEIGTVDELYFDDETWAIRYLTVETGNWLDSRRVLISPRSILQTDGKVNRIDVSLTREQVEKAPSIDTQLPVSRQHEAEYFDYYGYPYYWDGPYLWGASYYPTGIVRMPTAENIQAERIRKESANAHLRSTEGVAGHHIEAQEGRSAMLAGLWWTTRRGRSAIWKWPRRIGGRVITCFFLLNGWSVLVGRNRRCIWE